MKKMSKAWCVALAALAAPAQADVARPLTRALANEVALYSMMASNAYADDPGKTRFELDRLGWKKVDLQGGSVAEGRNSYQPTTWRWAFPSRTRAPRSMCAST